MAKRSTTQHPVPINDAAWLPLRKAAELCGTTTDDLKQRINSGQLRAYTIERGGKRKFRVTRPGLISAGLLGRDNDRATASVDLLSLVREQNQRISALEDQRAQLSGQLGIALERLRSMDQRLSSLESAPFSDVECAVPENLVGRSAVDGLRQSILRAIAVPAAWAWKRERA